MPIDKIITHNGYLNFQHDIGVSHVAQCSPLLRKYYYYNMQWNANFYDFSFLLFSVAVLLKLSQSIYKDRKIRKICLPVMRYQYPQSLDEGQDDLLTNMISRNFQMTVSLCVADYALKRSIHLYFLLSVQLKQPQRRRGHGRQRKNDRFLRFKDDVRTMGDGSITDSKSNLMPSMVSCTIFPNYSSD